MFEKPNDVRNFVHKRILGAVGGFITGGPVAAVSGFVRSPTRRTLPRSISSPSQPFSPSPCPAGQRRASNGRCIRDVSLTIQALVPGGRTGIEQVSGRRPAGEAVMGRYGAALVPIEEARSVSTCLPGMVLGDDGFCYNRKAITNRERLYPKGTAPLLTGGDMSCIRKAALAAGRLQRTTKRLQKIGLLKK